MLQGEIAISSVEVVVQIRAAETGSADSDLHFVASGCGVGTLFDAQVFGAVKHRRCVRPERS